MRFPESTAPVKLAGMKRTWQAFLLILCMTVGRAADAATTYRFSPDLSREGNQLLLHLGGHGWLGLILINAVAVLAVALCTLYWARTPLAYVEPPEGQRDMWSFASYNLFGRVLTRAAFLWRASTSRPKNWRFFCQLIGVVVPPVLMLASVLAVLSWYALEAWHWTFYRTLYREGHYLFPYALLAPFYVAVVARFVRAEWRRFYSR